ncbi:hypothetical protein EHQ68_09150 [Leptospira congkakensis]|uniref:Uncharacterized protein n=1 Tax=Leptospira congkakensis TaxID=2484932 RepID=A0A4Z1AAZ1_9LEPT|nr:hypothetical protein [Leptospira congkakensis]TGL88792.1 hypothetical protein EHQ69_15220 [Leptospira congkakensis]TGL89378.1 hypothetical protein EHQ68_09150 [Leptospira congkakensis]TGL97346.1 hypothetical protein EHQ70_08645 [Leptospira congkakensis]
MNSNCLSCHNEIKIHKDRHSFSWKSELFQEAIQIENRQWCVHCHAPLTSQKEIYFRKLRGDSNLSDLDLRLLDEGINCVSCHVRNGKILGSQNSKNEYHEVVESNIGKSEFCANCHQFNFPVFNGDSIRYTNHPMQNTYEEWKSSGREESCQSCHYSNHNLTGPYDKKWFLDQFYDFGVDSEDGVLFISFRMTKGRGHQLPSGDLFRSLAVEVSKDSKFESLTVSKRWSRKYETKHGNIRETINKVLTVDTSLLFSKNTINIVFDKPTHSPSYVRLVYYYHDPFLGGKSNANVSPLVIFQKTIY